MPNFKAVNFGKIKAGLLGDSPVRQRGQFSRRSQIKSAPGMLARQLLSVQGHTMRSVEYLETFIRTQCCKGEKDKLSARLFSP